MQTRKEADLNELINLFLSLRRGTASWETVRKWIEEIRDMEPGIVAISRKGAK